MSLCLSPLPPLPPQKHPPSKTGESSEKDPELAALHGHTLGLLDLALSLFATTPLKLGEYLIRLLQVAGGNGGRDLGRGAGGKGAH